MNKRYLCILFICSVSLFLISAVSAADENQTNDVLSSNNYQIASNLSNIDIQSMFDDANEGDTFEFADGEYENISLVVDKN